MSCTMMRAPPLAHRSRGFGLRQNSFRSHPRHSGFRRAHLYERVDQPRGEFFHTHWTGTGGRVASSTYTV